MADLYRLINQFKHYDWGSPDLIPEFLGFENNGEVSPKTLYAEMWMGTHKGAPSLAEMVLPGKTVSLAELAGGELPFLFKLLAVESPLSIQAHPDKLSAEKGFSRENEAGIALNSPTRNYSDNNHKPEIICALTPFTLMVGFREPSEIRELLKGLQALPLRTNIFSALLNSLDTGLLKDFFSGLFNISPSECKNLAGLFKEEYPREGSGAILPEQWKLMKNFAARYPGDPAMLSPLYLNIITLQPGQAIFIPAGALHAHVSGFGIELMADSDNVLRGGLTPKHIDVFELINILDFAPFMPQIITPPASSGWFRYPAPCDDFSLSILRSDGVEKIFSESGPAICIVTQGELSFGSMVFKKGESFFVPPPECRAPVSFNGHYSLFIAGTGKTA